MSDAYNNLETKMFDLKKFTLKDMTECGSFLRKLGNGASSMEETANRIVKHLWTSFTENHPLEPSCALIRFFITCPFKKLEPALQNFASLMLGYEHILPAKKCLALLASSGVKPEWNSRNSSLRHKAIPLASEYLEEQSPMIYQLVKQFGLEVRNVIEPDEHILVEIDQKSYNVFYVPEALGSPYVPAQDDFVIPYGIKSVLGFGGMLPSGDLFAIIIFSKILIPHNAANMFKTIALNAKIAILPFVGNQIFSDVEL